MGIDFALDQLYATGWLALDTSGCEADVSGRWAPSVPRVNREFSQSGHALSIQHVQLFDCFRAEWSDATGQPAGAVVGQSEHEAAVYALAQLRRAGVAAS